MEERTSCLHHSKHGPLSHIYGARLQKVTPIPRNPSPVRYPETDRLKTGSRHPPSEVFARLLDTRKDSLM